MATRSEPSLAGIRLQQARKSLGLTASDLADRIPDPSMTKTVITNVESGRKRDLTATELFQVASALGKSPINFMVGSEPLEPVAIPGLAEPFTGMCVAEYLVTVGANDVAGMVAEMHLFRRLRFLEQHIELLARIEALTGAEKTAIEGGTTLSFTRPDWKAWITPRDLEPDGFYNRLRAVVGAADALRRELAGQTRLQPLDIAQVGWLQERVDRALGAARAVQERTERIERSEDGTAPYPN